MGLTADATLSHILCVSIPQQTVASELAGWQEEHVKVRKEMLRKLAKDTVVREKARLGSMQRALREIQKMKEL